jgi:hypothetical protein
MAMGAPEAPRLDQDPLLLCFLAIVVVPALIMAGYYVALARPPYYEEPHYSVAIDSASGVGPVCSGGRRVADPEFNLTFRLDSRGLSLPGCADRGMHLEVSYRGALLASAIATTESVCVDGGKAVDWPVVARAAGVVVPDSVACCLVADVHNGAEVFDVALLGSAKERTVRQWTGISPSRRPASA